jgi:mannose/cellobiose epimerase-like protein (N-acyl-D-glucosamine 2-epimerase family)
MKTLKTSLMLVAVVAAMGLQSARADQPHMKNALMHLREARAALQRAEHNKGGHRERAVEIINRAIAEVEAGMAAAR